MTINDKTGESSYYPWNDKKINRNKKKYGNQWNRSVEKIIKKYLKSKLKKSTPQYDQKFSKRTQIKGTSFKRK